MTNPARTYVFLAAPLLGALTFGVLAACSDGARPEAAVDTATQLLADEDAGIDSGWYGATPEPEAATEPGQPKHVCVPRSTQECRFYYKDESGQQQCPMSYQICSLDGSQWLPCAQYTVDQDGDIIHL